MINKKFKDGRVTIPDDFIELTFIAPRKAEIPIVMTVKNESIYGTPRFYFFANTYPRNFSKEDIDYLLDQAEKYYPGFRELDDKSISVKPVVYPDGTVNYEFYDNTGAKRSYEEWKTAPAIGIFQMEQRSSLNFPPLPYGIEIKYKWGRDPRKKPKLLDR